jgi:hypothetical protein
MIPKPKDGCCKEVNRPSVADIEALDQDVHTPKFRPGKDHELLEGYHHRGEAAARLKGMDFLSSDGSMYRIKIRFKPKEVLAYFVESEHIEDGNSKRKRKSGWLVPGLGRGVFYVPEEQFNKYFEFVEDEGRIIA